MPCRVAELYGDDGWKTEMVKNLFDEGSAMAILDSLWPTQLDDDILLRKGFFYVRSSYQLEFLNCEGFNRASCWSRLWKLKIHEQLKVFLRRIMVGTIPTRDLVCEKTSGGERSCGICGEEEESYFHLFKTCHGNWMIAFASKWGYILDNWKAKDMKEILDQCLNQEATLFYYYWNFRNTRVHEGQGSVKEVAIHFQRMVE